MKNKFSINPAVFDKDNSKWRSVRESESGVKAETLTFATYNIWFGNYYSEQRNQALLDLLKNTGADIIGLQEITSESLDLILEQEWIRGHYYISDSTGHTFVSYGVILLSRIPINGLWLYPLESEMDRSVLIAEFNINGHRLQTGVTHLESYRESSPLRSVQLKKIFHLLDNSEHAVLMGDFNFCSSWKENSNIDKRYKDIWKVLRGDEPGYTEDTDINIMRLKDKGKQKKVRFDRILIRSSVPGWKPKKIQLLGTGPISPDYPCVFPSDHFGLAGTAEWVSAH